MYNQKSTMTVRYEINPPKISDDGQNIRNVLFERIEAISSVCNGIHLTDSVLGIPRVSPFEIAEQTREHNKNIKITCSLRIRGKNKGCASFSRGEGIWYDNDYVYFTATSGGRAKLGQIWRYKHIGKRGAQGELELFFESSSKNILNMPDNITVSPWGDLFISEDGKGHDRLVGIKPDGKCYYFAENILNKSEFAGATFSPNGNILFVNIYNPTMTIAIEGPWSKL